MGWAQLPVSAGEEVKASQIQELRAAIIERRRAAGLSATAGLGDPAEVGSGQTCTAETLNAFRRRVENLFSLYLDTNESGNAWTKSSILEAALGSGKTEWTTVPARAGTPYDSADLEKGDVIYAEHINEMKEVIDLLYLLPLEEKDGRQYASNTGSGWTWSDTDPDLNNSVTAVGNYQASEWGEGAESAPFGFVREPIGDVTVTYVKARGTLIGADGDRTVKQITFVYGDTDDPQPTDRDWKAQLRVSEAWPVSSPRDSSAVIVLENNLADDASHSSDGKNDSPNLLEVYVIDNWGPVTLPDVPHQDYWPFWLTFVMEDHASVIDAYAAEAQATERELQIWWGKALFEVKRIWAKLDCEYKS